MTNNITFIIAAQIDCSDRLDNLDITMNTIHGGFPGAQVILLESSHEEKLANRYEWCSYHYVNLQPTEVFNKMKLYNEGARLAQHSVLCFVDVDVPPSITAVLESYELIVTNVYDVVYPYGKSQGYNIPKELHAQVVASGDVCVFDSSVFPWLSEEYKTHYMESGGLILCSTTAFIFSGGGNENFIGWGCEDDELLSRFSRLGYRLGRLDERILLHLQHERGANPLWYDYAKYERANRLRLATVRNMSTEQLQTMVCKWNNFGNPYKQAEDLTVIISGSCLDSHPETTFIGEVIESLKLTGISLDTPIILSHDKIKPGSAGFEEKEASYKKYFENLQKYCSSSDFKNIQIVKSPAWGHLTRSLKNAVDMVKTRYMLVLQHDIHIRREVPLMRMIDLMKKQPHIKHLRFNVRRNHPTFMWWDGYTGGTRLFAEEEYDGVKVCVTPAWSDQNHLTTKEYYDTVVFPDCTNSDGELLYDFMENRLNGMCHHNHTRYGTYIYGEYGAPRTSRHSDGRKSSPEADED